MLSTGLRSVRPCPDHVRSIVSTLNLPRYVTGTHAGTIPRVDPSEELPEVDQNPPESVTAGPTAGYAARGGDNQPI